MKASSALARLPYAVALIAGVGLVVLTFAASQFSASSAADRLIDATSPIVNSSGVGRMRADLDKAGAVADALVEDGLAELTSLSDQTVPLLVEDSSAQSPAIAIGLWELPSVRKLAEAVVGNLENRLDQFAQAESLPGFGLSLNQATWGRFALAVLLGVIGGIGLARPDRRLAIAVLASGALMAIPPLALGHPAKAAGTDALLDSLRPFTVEKVEAREDALTSARGLFEGFRNQVIPAVATKAGLTPDEVLAELAGANPELSEQSLDEVEAILDRFEGFVEFSRDIQPELVAADEISARTAIWLLIGPGLALMLAAIAALAQQRTRSAGFVTRSE